MLSSDQQGLTVFYKVALIMERDSLLSWILVAPFPIARSGPSDKDSPDNHGLVFGKHGPKFPVHRLWTSLPCHFVARNLFQSLLTDIDDLSRTLQAIPDSSSLQREPNHLRFTSLMTGQVPDGSGPSKVPNRTSHNEQSSHISQNITQKVKSLGGFTLFMNYELHASKTLQVTTCIFAKRKILSLMKKLLLLAPNTKKESEPKTIIKSESSSSLLSVSLDPSILDARAEVDLRFWQRVVAQRIQLYGATHVATVDAMLELGKEFWNANDFAHASNVLEHAVDNARAIADISMSDDRQLLVACAMEKLGWCLSFQFKDPGRKLKAIEYVEGAFKIRYHILGLYHGDTIESLNVMAGVHGRLGDFQRAVQAYNEALLLRRAVYGPYHPSVAVASHKLGQIHARLHNAPRALQYFDLAKRIYVDQMKLPQTNPSLAILQNDLRALQLVPRE